MTSALSVCRAIHELGNHKLLLKRLASDIKPGRIGRHRQRLWAKNSPSPNHDSVTTPNSPRPKSLRSATFPACLHPRGGASRSSSLNGGGDERGGRSMAHQVESTATTATTPESPKPSSLRSATFSGSLRLEHPFGTTGCYSSSSGREGNSENLSAKPHTPREIKGDIRSWIADSRWSKRRGIALKDDGEHISHTPHRSHASFGDGGGGGRSEADSGGGGGGRGSGKLPASHGMATQGERSGFRSRWSWSKRRGSAPKDDGGGGSDNGSLKPRTLPPLRTSRNAAGGRDMASVGARAVPTSNKR